jgi:ParB/RepB/Spo0J family partition protein
MPELKVTYQPLSVLKTRPRNPRTHTKKQIRQIADSIKRFGFTNPILVDNENTIVAGHGRVEAAKLLQMEAVPVIYLSDLSEAEIRAYVLADNKLAENAGWDQGLLALELQYLSELDLDFDLTITGF